MRRYNKDHPTDYWYELVEVFYGEDGRPMMWGNASVPMVSYMDVEDAEDENDFNLAKFIREQMANEWQMMGRDIGNDKPILDERDFEEGGLFADHPEALEMQKVAEVLDSGDDEAIAKLGLSTWDPNKFFKSDDDKDQGVDTI